MADRPARSEAEPSEIEIEVTPEMIEVTSRLLLQALKAGSVDAVVEPPHEPFGAIIDGQFDLNAVARIILVDVAALLGSQRAQHP